METTHPLLGPLFIGILLNMQAAPTLLQLEHWSAPDSVVASHRIYVEPRLSIRQISGCSRQNKHTFFRRHSSQALDTFDLFLGAL